MAASGSRPEFSIIRSMKRSSLTPPLASATLFLILASAANLPAQEMSASAGAAKASQRAGELLKRYDKNGDGRIDDDERADAKEVMMKDQIDRQMARATALPGGLEQFRVQALELFDRNRDGRLDEAERAAAQKFVAIRDEAATNAAQLVKRFDRNGDGIIDATEQATIDSFIGELRALGSSQARSELLRLFDRNSDGKIDDEEFVEVEKFVRPRIESAPANLRRHDTNGNGMLDDAEWPAARRAILQWLNASGPAAMAGESLSPEELERQKRLTEDLARRRAQSERSAASGEPAVSRKSSPAEEQARLNAVAAEVARRRAVREAAPGSNPPPK
jgi:Ca2+-binding EF-hand superfamily protein